jgi:flagellar protein FliS
MNQNYGKAASNYLIQEISGSSPEHIMFMLLEGAQRFLLQAVVAIKRRDITTRARMVNRVSSIVEEMAVRLDHEGGGELVLNLTRIYDWWLKELFEASQKNQADRLEIVERQIAEMKAAWADLDQRQASTPQAAFTIQGMVG